MLYNLSNKLDQERFKRRSNELCTKSTVVELIEKNKRTTSQNSYLHLLIGYLAIETGNTREYVKREYFKITCNPELFIISRYDKMLDMTMQDVRSSSELSTTQMAVAIDRFRNWSAENGVYLPEAGENEFLTEIQIEINKQHKWL